MTRDAAHLWASTEELARWARSAPLDAPLDWGAVETRILSVAAPDPADLEQMYPRRNPLWFVLVLVPLVPVALLIGCGVVVLGCTIAYVRSDGLALFEWRGGVQLLAYLSIVVTLLPLLQWWENKRRDGLLLLITAGTAAASVATFVLLGSVPSADVWSTIRALAGVAAVTGTLSTLLMVVLGKSGVGAPLSERLRPRSREERWRRNARAAVLEALEQRGLVARDDMPALMDQPRGTWHQLETLPDGRTVRRGP